MTFHVKFQEQGSSFLVRFGELQTASDGGFDRGYAVGYEKGYTEGLSERTYEIWTVTYVDGTVEEKEVALL